jgi:DNA-binding transcriptional MocR family regulator
MLKMTTERELISFAGGLPDAQLFPTNILAELAEKVIREHGRTALQYAPTEGLLPLREKIASLLRAKGVEVGTDQILITQGSQQGIDLLSKLFLDPGTGLLTENPSYLGALQSFRFFEANLVPVAVDGDGMILADLLKVLQERPRLAYLMPNFQNPTGIQYSAHRRQEVAERLAEQDVLLVEDDPYGELIYEGTVRPSLWSFYPSNLKVHLGTFSKTIVPGLRVAYLVSDPELIHRLVLIKQATDLHTNSLGQWIVNAFLEEGHLEEHIERIQQTYRIKRDTMEAAIRVHFPPFASHETPKGGMFFWVRVPGNLNVASLSETCLGKGVAFVLGSDFFIHQPQDEQYLRLNFTSVPVDKIEQGIRLIGEEMKNLTPHPEPVSALR